MVFKAIRLSRCAGIAFLSYFLIGMAQGPPFVGGPAPSFELRNLQGAAVKLSDLKGSTVVLNFWATWCVPCIKEMPELQKAHRSLKDKGIKILAVNFGERETKVQEFVEEYKLDFPVLLDTFGTVAEEYKVIKLPVTYFITPQGIVRDEVVGGGLTQAVIESKIFREH